MALNWSRALVWNNEAVLEMNGMAFAKNGNKFNVPETSPRQATILTLCALFHTKGTSIKRQADTVKKDF